MAAAPQFDLEETAVQEANDGTKARCTPHPLAGLRMAALLLAAGSALIGVLGVLAWHFRWPVLLTFHESSSALHYNTALLLALAGVSFGAALGQRNMLARGLGAVVTVSAALIGCNELLELHWGLNAVLFSGAPVRLTRVAPNTAVAMALAGLGVFLLAGGRTFRWRGAVISGLGSVVTIIAGLSLFGYLFAVTAAYRWREFNAMSLPAALGLLLLGAALAIGGRLRMMEEKTPGPQPLITVLAIALGGASFLGWQPLDWQRDKADPASVVPEALLMGMLLASGLAVATTWFALVARQRQREMEQANAALQQEMRRREAADAELLRTNRALRAITDCNQALVHGSDEQHLLETICRIFVEQCGYVMAWIGYAEQDEARTVRPVAKAGREAGYLDSARITWDEEPRGQGPTGRCIRSAQPQLCRDAESDPHFGPWREAALRRGVHSCIAFPLKHEGTAFGAVSIYAGERDAFHQQEIQLLAEVADDLAFGIQALRARRAREGAEKQLEEQQFYSRSLIEANLDPLVTISREGKITDVNRAAEEVTGMARERLIGSDFSDYFSEPERARAGYEKVFREGTVRDYPLAVRHVSGRLTDVVYNATVYRDRAGQVAGVFAGARDITERKRAEAALQRYASELEHSNAELQDFASIASHDLQEPLRKVMAFGDRLREHSGSALDETGQDFLRRMQNAAARMSQLIESLLQYSRVTSRAQPFDRVDLTQVAIEVVGDLEESIVQAKAIVSFDVLPIVNADRVQMRQLLQNLLANALKFHAGNRRPEVGIDLTHANGNGCEFVVSDNGVGFDEAYSDRLFRPFQRLHSRNEFPGSGMGLAICRKIVERHGGKITVHSRQGEGSHFVVSLPRQPRTQQSEAISQQPPHSLTSDF